MPEAKTDSYIMNGNPTGDVGNRLMTANWDVGALRPWLASNGRTYMTVLDKNGKTVNVEISNANTSLRQYDWKQIDKAVVQAAKPRLKAVDDLRSRGLTYVIPNGMSKTVLQTETETDINDAQITMDAIHKGPADRPQWEVTNLPLPIIHYDFHYSLRQIQASREGGSPLDTTTAAKAGRKVAEAAEKLLLGKWSPASYTYGGGTITGYTNFGDVMTQTITSPATSGWTGQTLLTELLAARQQSKVAYHYGPWALYVGPTWGQYLDQDWSTQKGSGNIRDRLAQTEGIESIKELDYLTTTEMLLVQMSSDVVRLVDGMDITTVQWSTDGGMLLHFKTMAIIVPQLRSDINDRTGIVYMSVA